MKRLFTKKKRNSFEAGIQASFFSWLTIFRKKYRPYCFSIPNGGSRHIVEAMNLKIQGVTAGVPDIFCALPRKGFHGLFIEFKFGKNKLTETQKRMIMLFSEVGYKCSVCYSLASAVKDFDEYIEESI